MASKKKTSPKKKTTAKTTVKKPDPNAAKLKDARARIRELEKEVEELKRPLTTSMSAVIAAPGMPVNGDPNTVFAADATVTMPDGSTARLSDGPLVATATVPTAALEAVNTPALTAAIVDPAGEIPGVFNFTVEDDEEEDGRKIAEVLEIPGSLGYGHTPPEAQLRAQIAAIRALADRLQEEADGGNVLEALKAINFKRKE